MQSPAFAYLIAPDPNVVLLDLVMPEVNGMELLEKMVASDSAADIILMTGHYSTESAVEAIQKGAYDYLTKPLDVGRLRTRILGLLKEAENRQRALQLESALVDTFQFEGLIGRSPVMLETFAKIRRVASHFQSILITGATGTGKELVAGALHRLSPRASAPFIVCNCSALVETLLESELFGYVRGAFTGATRTNLDFLSMPTGVLFSLTRLESCHSKLKLNFFVFSNKKKCSALARLCLERWMFE
ncbi:MAG TPA: sigma 54-interacting transcriptional regulator [Candidatus Acidoferrum sp.]|nr:sigma 54-interacting transcriptional regulator [Candidatus Acidoferrum sp.]